MLHRSTSLVTIAAAAGFGLGTVHASETFHDPLDQNVGGWNFDTVMPTWLRYTDCGGPSPHIRMDHYDDFAVWISASAPKSPFNGNFRKTDVTRFGIDVRLNWTGQYVPRELSLMIYFDDKLNEYPDAQYLAYLPSDQILEPGNAWQSFEFEIPSGDDTLPSGWTMVNEMEITDDPPITWPELMENVSHIRLMTGNPEFFYIFSFWDVSFADPWIARKSCVAADLNCDGLVDVFDLLILLSSWGPCDSPGTCTGDLNHDGVVDVFDLLILLGDWG